MKWVVRVVLVIVAGGIGCSPKPVDPQGSASAVQECLIPADQAGTISGRWPVAPIKLAIHQGDFQPDEAIAITTAANTWNQFYEQSRGFLLVDYGGNADNPWVSSTPKPFSICSGEGIIANNQFTAPIVIYKQTQWAYDKDIVALTSFCSVTPSSDAHSENKPYNYFYMAVTELNYDTFFVAGKKQPDLQSIVLHELGHLIGLNHSCEFMQKAGFPNCADTGLSPDYFHAVMYPSVLFQNQTNGESRRELQTNDMQRANCLY